MFDFETNQLGFAPTNYAALVQNPPVSDDEDTSSETPVDDTNEEPVDETTPEDGENSTDNNTEDPTTDAKDSNTTMIVLVCLLIATSMICLGVYLKCRANRVESQSINDFKSGLVQTGKTVDLDNESSARSGERSQF